MEFESPSQLKLLNFQHTLGEKFLNNESIDNQSQINQNVTNQSLTPQVLIAKRSVILSKPNDLETEKEFRRICSLYKNSFYNRQLSEAYQEYIDAYHKITSLYAIEGGYKRQINLITYGTEKKEENTKIIEISEWIGITSCITLIPNGGLFCCCRRDSSSVALIIDSNYEARMLPSVELCYLSAAIYLNRNVYCFGGFNSKRSYSNEIPVAWSLKFDLDENRWIKLTPMPEAETCCHASIFNESILISGYFNKNLLLYSVDIDSFSTIPFEFSESKRKILIRVDRLYLIECPGIIYESEIEDIYEWKQVANSRIFNSSNQVYCSYNKGRIYINAEKNYYNFDLQQKVIFNERLI